MGSHVVVDHVEGAAGRHHLAWGVVHLAAGFFVNKQQGLDKVV